MKLKCECDVERFIGLFSRVLQYIYQTDPGTIFRPESNYWLMFDKNFY